MTLRAMLAVLFIVLFHASAFAQEYEVRIDRPVKPGDRFHTEVTSTVRYSATSSYLGEIRKEESGDDVAYEAQETVLETAGPGERTRVQVTVTKLRGNKGEGWQELLAPGTMVEAFLRDGDEVYEVNGKPVTPEASAALHRVAPLWKGETTDGEIVDPRDRKRIGESWSIDKRRAAKDFGVPEGSITGSASLNGITRQDGAEFLSVSTEITIPFTPSLAYGTLERGELKMDSSYQLPLRPLDRNVVNAHVVATSVIVNEPGTVRITEVKERRDIIMRRPL